jgi:hypothetical protein
MDMKDAASTDGLNLPSWDDVLIAHERIAPYIHRTPVLTSQLHERTDRGGAVLQVRELPEGGRVQGARRDERCLRPVRRDGQKRVSRPIPAATTRCRCPTPLGDAAFPATS